MVESEPELTTLLVLEQIKRLREFHTTKTSTLSGMIPVYEIPETKSRKKKPGQKQGNSRRYCMRMKRDGGSMEKRIGSGVSPKTIQPFI